VQRCIILVFKALEETRTVFSTAFELRGADLPSFSRAGKKILKHFFGEKKWGVKNTIQYNIYISLSLKPLPYHRA
jgi:hypothetical protein